MFRLSLRAYHFSFDLGIHSAIYGKICPGDVGRFRTGDKRHQCSDLINATEAVECGGGLLRHRPLARGGIQLRVDRTRLHVVDRDAPAPELSGERLSKYLYGSLRGRVSHKPGHNDMLAQGRTNRDDATAALHVLQRRLRRDEYAADVNVEHAIHFFQRRFLKRFRNGRAGIVYQDVESAECRHGFFDCGFARLGISGIGLNRDRFSAIAFDLLNHRRGRISTFRVCDGYLRSVGSQTFGDGGANAARAASDECNLSFQFSVHDFVFLSEVLLIHYVSTGIKLTLDKSVSSDLFTYRYEIRDCYSTARTTARLRS